MQSQGYQKETAIVSKVAYISFFVTCVLCMTAYLICFSFVFSKNCCKAKGANKQQNKTKCCDPLRYGYKIFLLLIWPLIALSI